MRRSWDPTFLAVIVAALMVAGTVAATGGMAPGEWRAKLDAPLNSVRVELRLAEENWQTRVSTDIPAGELEGFDAAAFGRSGAPLRLSWKRDPGTFFFEGEGGRRPNGKIRFEPDAAFAERWRSLGLEEPSVSDRIGMAVHGVRLADVERLHELGIRDLASGSVTRLAHEPDAMRWIEELHELGVQPRLEDVFRLRAHGVPAEYAAELRSSGFPNVELDDIVRLHDHGVPASYAKAIVEIGPGVRDADDVIRLHTHGVSTDFMRSLSRSGASGVSTDRAIRAWTRGEDSLDAPEKTEQGP